MPLPRATDLRWSFVDTPGSTQDPASSRPPTPTARAWIVWLTGVLVYGVAIMHRTSLGVMGLTAAQHFGAPASVVSTFMVLQLAVYALGQIPAGLLLDRFGPRRVLTAGAALMTLGQVLIAVAHSPAEAMAARTLVGLGDACTFGSAIRLVPLWFPARQVPLLTQLTGLLGQVGQIVSAVVLVPLVEDAGWRTTYLVAAAVGVAAVVGGALLLRDAPPGVRRSASTTSLHDLPRELVDIARHPATRLAFWAHWTTNFPAIVFSMMWGMPYLTRAEGRSTATASALMTLFVLANAAGGPVVGILTNRYPLRRDSLILGTIVLSVIPWTVVLLWPGRSPLWLLVVLAAGLGLTLPGGAVGFDVARTSHPGHRLGTATGIAIMGGFIAGLADIQIIGLLLDRLCPGGRYTLSGFRWAMATQLPFFAVGIMGIIVNRVRLRRILAAHGVVVPTWRQALERNRRLRANRHG